MERNCLGCGQVDDHPRHVIALSDGSDACWHNDCHARSSVRCAICQAVVDSAGDLKGDELRAHLLDNDPGAPVASALNDAQVAHFHALEG